ncbi:DHH family phosphoesterase [Halococcus qingdaonensis]|uniref:DHH family phosphoesterase n=1 Tax=Halococcus qingdaonensis TaxID=224402 RepID=UPI0021172952|nr:recombinase RecJ [Halococcus qingdaonensis]
MNDRLIDDEHLPLARKSLLPGTGFFYPDSFDEERAERETRETVTSAERVVIADPDADGLACVALIREAFGPTALVPAGPHDLSDAIDRVADHLDAGARVFVCDLVPDDFHYIAGQFERLTERASAVSWFDHHQWDDEDAEKVRSHGARLVVGDSDEECSADVTLAALDHEFDPQWAELAAVTRDHDLWLREDPRSDDLADFAYWADPEEYVETIGEHGADLPVEIEEYLAEQRVEKEALIERAVERATIEEIGPWTVGVTYGRCSQNEVAEALREEGADAAVVVKPSGSASIRGSEGFERCHEVAGQVNGGGHPKAAGCKPDIYDDMLDYANHWTTRGAVTKQVIQEAFGRLLENEDAQ